VEGLAAAYLTSLTGSSGQLCTAPGLVFVPRGEAGDAFLAAVARLVSRQAGQRMLTPGIAQAWRTGVGSWSEQDGVALVGQGRVGPGADAPAPAVYAADVTTFLDNPVLHDEVFGAAGLVVRYDDADDLLAAAARLEGQLTATLHLTGRDHDTAARLLPVLELKVGRIVVNGWPTGVDVGHAMVHGGPFPATTAPWTTSVGSRAIERWLRPVAYQDVPDDLLPEPVREANPWGLTRRVDGRLEVAR
jgi:NADP-dependent aldehyde dehydrogenase